MGALLVLGELEDGRLTDPSLELAAKAARLGEQLGVETVMMAIGDNAAEALAQSGLQRGIAVETPGVPYSPLLAERAALTVMAEVNPGLVLMPTTTLGMDLGASLAARQNRPVVAYCVALEKDGDHLRVRCQVFGGKLTAHVEVPADGAIITVIPGSWPKAPGSDPVPQVTAVESLSIPSDDGLTVLETLGQDAGADVDITRADVLVSVGRGIEDPDNLELADALAEALGGVVSCSRPVVDAGWLPRSRQVGKSGRTVKPKCYLALGISGAPEHLQGMKDAELIIAVNQDASAPIFEVAHYGATVDILELMPALTEHLQEG